MKSKLYILFIALAFSLFTACSKGWLEEKQDIKLVIPTTLNDFEMLLNNEEFYVDGRGPCETSCDDAEFTKEQFDALAFYFDRDYITWKSPTNIIGLSSSQNDWEGAYKTIRSCNIVIKGLEKIKQTKENEEDYNRVLGTALFHRGRNFLSLAMTYCKYYDANTAKTDLGIPLKLDDDIGEVIYRASLEDTYQQIIKDLKQASELLQIPQRDYTQIAKGGAYGYLARSYLFMDKYEEAKNAADSSLKYHPYIEDYNLVNGTPSTPFTQFISKEIHLLATLAKPSQNYGTGRINKELFELYSNSDLRKTLFFKIESDGKPSFRGRYTGILFAGTTSAESLLILAETRAREGDKNGALDALNVLMKNRIKNTDYTPISATNNQEALEIILKERRKELVTRGLRWQDIKRLNKEPQFAKTLVRIIGNDTYTLPPNDPRFALPIPQYIIDFNGIEQNKY